VLCCHRRMGKTVACVNHIIRDALRTPKATFAYVAPFYSQAKRIAWEYFRTYTEPVPGMKWNESELCVIFPNGSKVYLLGSDNPNAIRGMALWGVVMDEYADQSPDVFGQIISPCLADHSGYAVFCGTIKGKNHLWKLWDKNKDNPSWHSMYVRASESGIIPDAELAIQQSVMTEDEYQQEYELDPMAAVKGAIFGKEMRWLRDQGRIRDIPFEEYATVDTWWDLGVAQEHRVIDCYSTCQTSLAEVAKVVRAKGWNYGTHYLPHDAKQHELQSNKTREQFLREMLPGRFEVVARPRAKDEAINAFRLQHKKLWIDQKNQAFLDAMEQYSQEWDDDIKAFKPVPKHDWCSHYADAATLWALKENRDRVLSPIGGQDRQDDRDEDVGGLLM
jgi:phage terminase large subunit